MASVVGHLEVVKTPGKPTVYMGEISMASYQGDVALIPIDKDVAAEIKKRGKNPPNYVVKRRRQNGDWFEGGASWTKEMKAGGWFHSIQLDGDDLHSRVNVAAFADDKQPKETPENDPAWFSVKWGRMTGAKSVASAGAAQSDDHIPY